MVLGCGMEKGISLCLLRLLWSDHRESLFRESPLVSLLLSSILIPWNLVFGVTFYTQVRTVLLLSSHVGEWTFLCLQEPPVGSYSLS